MKIYIPAIEGNDKQSLFSYFTCQLFGENPFKFMVDALKKRQENLDDDLELHQMIEEFLLKDAEHWPKTEEEFGPGPYVVRYTQEDAWKIIRWASLEDLDKDPFDRPRKRRVWRR